MTCPVFTRRSTRHDRHPGHAARDGGRTYLWTELIPVLVFAAIGVVFWLGGAPDPGREHRGGAGDPGQPVAVADGVTVLGAGLVGLGVTVGVGVTVMLGDGAGLGDVGVGVGDVVVADGVGVGLADVVG